MDRNITVQRAYVRWRDDLFFLAYLFLFFYAMFSQYLFFSESTGSWTETFARVLYILFIGSCVLCLFLRDTYSVLEVLSIGGLLVLGVISYLYCGDHIFFDLTLIIAIAKGVDFEKFLKRAAIMLALFLFVVICLAGLEVLNSVVKTRVDNDQMRNSLGFGHPNALGLMVFQLIAIVIAVERKRLKTVHLWLLLGLGLLFYWITKSQSCLVAVCLLIGAVLVYKLFARKVWSQRQMKIAFGIILAAVAVGMAVALRYFWVHPEVLPFSTLSDRIIYAQRYLDAYGLNLFGHDNILIGDSVALPGYASAYEALDNGEMWYLLRFGIVGFGVFAYLFVRMVIKAVNKREFVLCIIAIVYFVYSLTENTACRIPFDFMLVYAAIMIYSGNLFQKERSERDAANHARQKWRSMETEPVSSEPVGIGHE